MAQAHPEAMAPKKPGGTRTAPPQRPPQFPLQGRYRAYTLFDSTGLIYLLVGLLALKAVWALGTGEAAWDRTLSGYANPIYLAFHAFALVCVIFVGVRFFRLFPKAQPAVIGPVKLPPRPILHAGLYAVWVAVSGGLALVLAGGIF